jgi:beta-glucosidase
MYERGVALGQEFKGKGVHMYLGPSVGALGRKPRGGRNWEGFGSDPVLQAVAGAATIKGVQDQGVIAVLKHFIGNEQEMYRMYHLFQPGYSANIGMRRLSSRSRKTDRIWLTLLAEQMIEPCTRCTCGHLPKVCMPVLAPS